MTDPTLSPPASPDSTVPRGGRRILRWLAAPFRSARRRPRRAAIVVLVFVLLTGLTAFGGIWFWFNSHLRSARQEIERGHNAAAIPHLQACQRVYSEQREVLILQARLARRGGAWDEADAILTRYWQRYGDEDPLVLERLLLRATRGDAESVTPQLSARIQNEGPDARLAREALASGLLYQFRWVEADALLAGWLEKYPDDTTAILIRGKLEEQRQQYARAVEAFRRVVELDPEHDEARLRLTTLLLANRMGKEALEHLTELRKRLPNHPEVAVQWARALALEGRTAESRAALDACLREHPDFPLALAERGSFALLDDGKEAEAERDLARAAALDPGNLAVRSQYALALARNGKPADAAREQKEIDRLKADGERITALIEGDLQRRPNDPSVHHEIAQIARRSGQVREAIRWYESALKVDPNYLPTHRELAGLYRDIENPILASKHRATAQRLAAQQKQ